MSSNPDVLFAPPNHVQQFGALAYILGTFQPHHDEEIISFIRGQFITPDGLELKASIKRKDWDRLTKKDNFTEDSQFYWRGYFRTTKQGTLTKIQLLRRNYSASQMREVHRLLKTQGVRLAVNQVRYSLLSRQSFSGQGLAKIRPILLKLEEFSQKYQKTPAQIALNWLISQGGVIAVFNWVAHNNSSG